jgi:hypothetical protein
MTTAPPPPDHAPWPFFNAYTLLCLAALAVLSAVEMQQGLRFATPLVLLVGLVGVLARLRSAPLLLLFAFAVGHLVVQHSFVGFGWEWQDFRGSGRPFRATDVVVCAAVLAYVVGHYRLQAVSEYVFPPDPRLREVIAGRRRVVQRKRSPRLVTIDEVGWLVLALPVPALLGQLGWMALARPWNVLGLPPQVGRFVLLLWLLAVTVFVVAALLGHWRGRRQTAEEGTLFLQDTLWRETRREQRLVNRWVAWSRRRKEQA